MRALVLVAALALFAALAGCSTMTMRAGAVVINGTPAFQATLEIGTSFGSRRLYELTHENGVQAGASGFTRVAAVNANVVTLDEELGPIARIGARFRASHNSASIGARAAFYPGLLRDAKSRSGGLGFELGGGAGFGEAVIEASIVMTGKWSID